MGLTTLDTQYTDQVVVTLMVPSPLTGQFIAQVTEKTNGRAVIEDTGSLYYGTIDKEVILFD